MAEHDGHRKRMRQRFREEGLEGFAPHEVLELLLFYGRSRGNTNPLAHDLLTHFGSLKGVLEADPEQLMSIDGIGEESATLISLMLPMFRRYSRCIAEERKQISSLADAADYCRSLLAGERTEHFYGIFLAADGHLLGTRLIAEGTNIEVQAYPRKVAEAALYLNASCVVLCHNHPDGECVPSQDDIQATRHMQDILSGLQINVLDHIIVAGDSTHSMVQHNEFDL